MRLAPFWLRFNKKCMSGGINKKYMSSGSKKRRAPEGVEPLLDLPGPLLLKVLGRMPNPELRRLLRGRVSSRFSAAIKAVLLEMLREAGKTSLDLDEKGATEEDAYYQTAKAQYIVSPPHFSRSPKPSYSARDCNWRYEPLSQLGDPKAVYTGWPFNLAEPYTWIKGGRDFQAGLPLDSGAGWGSDSPRLDRTGCEGEGWNFWENRAVFLSHLDVQAGLGD
jgi:hypothetical protein